MASWEAAALKLQSHVAVTSDPNSLDKDKCLPPLPLQHKSTVTTKIEAIASEQDSNSTKGWKPLSLSTPILLAVIALTLLLAAAVETIAQRSAAQGGLALSPTLDDLPGYAKFSYLYVPTIIAVLYSMIWSWIDLDVKRMQPWFELSKPKGATAENSLFLDYQYEFVALVPFRAAKSKHWPVFFAGTAMVIVFWALTPLQSAMLGTDIVKQTVSATLGIRSQLLPMQQQEAHLDPEFLNNGYAVGWLGQPFPPFTTSKYAILPFYTTNGTTPANVDSNITAVSTKLSTELNCWPAEIHQDGPKAKASFFFLNGQGCNTSVSFGVTSRSRMYYIGYYSSPYSDFFLSNKECPKTSNSTHQFLAIWSQTVEVPGQDSPDFNITALFCQPQYYKQQVFTRAKSSNLQPDSKFEQPMSSRQILSEQEFNSTAFEFLLANGMAYKPVVKDAPFNNVLEQHTRLNYTGFTLPVSNMVGFALAGKNLSSDAYADPGLLGQVYNDAHQYLFTLAVNKLLVNETDMSNQTASTEYFLSGVVVSRAFATAVECLLVVVAIFTIIVLRICRKTPSNLAINPSSINRYIELFRNSEDTLHLFKTMDNATEKSLLEEFKEDRFQLRCDKNYDSTIIPLDRVVDRNWKSDQQRSETEKDFFDPVRPLALQRWSGVLFVLVLVGAMIFLSYLKQEEARLHGLHRPSENFEVLQILENYIPTIFATLIEPFWVLLNRLLCVLQPFKDLWEGKARPSHSLDATYTSIPPQLVFLRAAKSKHFILVLVCAMALLANVLAVGLGSLFNEAPAMAEYPTDLMPEFAPKFDNGSVYGFPMTLSENVITTGRYQDPFYVAMANISSGTTLPPWVSKDYFFQSHNITTTEKSRPGDVYSLPARGFGARGNCVPVSASKLPIPKGGSLNENGRYLNVSESQCGDYIDYASRELRYANNNRSSGASAIEYCGTMGSTSGPVPCGRTLLLGWGRMASAENENGTIEASFMTCRPIFETAMFNLTVNVEGHVLAYERTSKLETALDYADSELHSDLIFQSANHIWKQLDFQWHNDTTARDWMSYLAMVTMGNRSILDPQKPVPEPETLVGVVDDIYRRVFAILLSLNEQLFDHTSNRKPLAGVRRTTEVRIFMEDASFIMTMTVLAMNTLVAMLFYSKAVPFVLPRMPTTIGSVLAYLAPSRLAGPAYTAAPGNSARTFSFGRYIGRDGHVHIGIDMDPHVVPVHPESLRARSKFLGWFERKKPQEDSQTVRSGTWL